MVCRWAAFVFGVVENIIYMLNAVVLFIRFIDVGVTHRRVDR